MGSALGQRKILTLAAAALTVALGAGVLDIRFSMVEGSDLESGNKKVSTQLKKVEQRLGEVVEQAKGDRAALRGDLTDVRAVLLTVVTKIDGHQTRLAELERMRASVEKEKADAARQLELRTMVKDALHDELKSQDIARWRQRMDETDEESRLWLERQRQRRVKTAKP